MKKINECTTAEKAVGIRKIWFITSIDGNAKFSPKIGILYSLYKYYL